MVGLPAAENAACEIFYRKHLILVGGIGAFFQVLFGRMSVLKGQTKYNGESYEYGKVGKSASLVFFL